MPDWTGHTDLALYQKARAAELNAARARRAAQMQSIDDEIPDLSGPVSLGTYKFTRRARSKKYETHRLSELQESHEKEGENKVTEPTPTSSAHAPFNPPPLTTFSSLQRPAHQFEAELDDTILNRSEKLSSDRRGFHEPGPPGPPQYNELGPSHYAANFPSPIRSILTDRQSSQVSGQAESSLPPAKVHCSSQDPNTLIRPDTRSSQPSGQVHSSFSPEYHNSNHFFSATINPYRQSLQPSSGQANYSFPLQDHSPNQNFSASIDTDGRGPQAFRQGYPSFPPPGLRPDTSQPDSQLANSLRASIQTKASGQAHCPYPLQTLQRHTSEPYHGVDSKVEDILAAHRRSWQASSQAHRPASPQVYSSPPSLPLSDTLPTASFNLETNQWDPDLPEADMSAQTPTNKSTRGGRSAQHSSRQSSSHGQQTRNPYAIVTTTKSGRPYTNPYMPIHPPPPTARQTMSESPSGHINPNTQSDDTDILQRQRNLRYIDQEEARYRALGQATYGQDEEVLDDPFQDQTTPTQHYGLNQPPIYAEYAAQQAAYGQLPDYRNQPTLTTYTADPNASSFFSNAPTTTHAPNAKASPYRGQHSAYEQQAVVDQRTQHPGAAPHEQRWANQPQAINPRASVRLPAVKGTTVQQKGFLQEPRIENLSLVDSNKNTQDQRRGPAQGVVQPAHGKLSHAIPIRDPAAYTGSGLTTRRNQEALRQNLDTVVASSQGPAGSARTVMNDPHRDRQPSDRPSSAITDTTVTGSTLRAQAPSYESVTTHPPVTTNPAFMKPRPGASRRQERAIPEKSEAQPLQYHAGNAVKGPERTAASTNTENVDPLKSFRAPTIPPGIGHPAAVHTRNAALPNAAIGAGNAFMNALVKEKPPLPSPQQCAEDAATWFRSDPRDLSYAAAILPRETMHRMNPEQFPLEDTAPRTVGQLADDSQDDDPSDRARQAATPRPIGHGRPAGYTTPPSKQGTRRAATQASSSTPAGVASVTDTTQSGRKFPKDDKQAAEAMFGGVYSNLMVAKNGPYDYLNHYCSPPAYAIDHNAKNNNTSFDPQWFATAPPARVGRDPRRDQGEYEDPTQGSAGRRGDHARGEASRHDGSGRAGSGGRAWGKF